jgi:hypothetical protein
VHAGGLDRDLVMSGVLLGTGAGQLAIDHVAPRERLFLARHASAQDIAKDFPDVIAGASGTSDAPRPATRERR